MLRIHPRFLTAAREATTAAELQELLQNAIRLEHATIPPYLTAAYSLQFGTNDKIRRTIANIAEEEMLHMAIVANVLNAIGGRPEFDNPEFIPVYPSILPMNIGDLEVGLKKFSKELVFDVFMKIEKPENPIIFPAAALAMADPTFATIGEFYRAMIEKIQELGEKIFTGDPQRQVVIDEHFPSQQLFPITNVETAVRAMQQVVREGEGTETHPLDDESEPAHYYRFEEIYRGHALVEDSSSPLGFSFSGAEIKFNPAEVFDIPDNPKAADYQIGSPERQKVDSFNLAYSNMLRMLQQAFDGEPSAIDESISTMNLLRRIANNIVPIVDPNSGKNLGLTFEFMPE